MKNNQRIIMAKRWLAISFFGSLIFWATYYLINGYVPSGYFGESRWLDLIGLPIFLLFIIITLTEIVSAPDCTHRKGCDLALMGSSFAMIGLIVGFGIKELIPTPAVLFIACLVGVIVLILLVLVYDERKSLLFSFRNIVFWSMMVGCMAGLVNGMLIMAIVMTMFSFVVIVALMLIITAITKFFTIKFWSNLGQWLIGK